MKVRVLRLGSAAHVVDCDPGATIGDALRHANVGTEGFTLSLNGLGTSTDAVVSEGDVVTMVPKVVGGVA